MASSYQSNAYYLKENSDLKSENEEQTRIIGLLHKQVNVYMKEKEETRLEMERKDLEMERKDKELERKDKEHERKDREIKRLYNMCLKSKNTKGFRPFSSIKNKSQRLKTIQAELKPLDVYFASQKCKPETITFRAIHSDEEDIEAISHHFIDFDNPSNNRCFIEKPIILKNINISKMDETQREQTFTKFQAFNEKMISDEIYSELTVGNRSLPSLKNFKILKQQLDSEFKVIMDKFRLFSHH